MRAVLFVLLGLLPGATPLLARAVITDGPAGEVASATATFTFGAEGGLVKPSGFECRLDGGAWSACTSPHTVDGLGGGPHGFDVRATGIGVDGAPAHRDWTVALQTEVTPPPVAQPGPGPAPRPRARKRRDAGDCPYGANQPGEVAARRVRAAVLCLVNAQRAAHDLPRLGRSAALERAAGVQVRDMLRRRYFAHTSPTGRTVAGRISAAGYLRGARFWTVGENLAWLVRPRPTALAVVRAWMRSPGHRKVILTAGFRDAGVGAGRGSPVRGNRSGATFALEVGRRD